MSRRSNSSRHKTKWFVNVEVSQPAQICHRFEWKIWIRLNFDVTTDWEIKFLPRPNIRSLTEIFEVSKWINVPGAKKFSSWTNCDCVKMKTEVTVCVHLVVYQVTLVKRPVRVAGITCPNRCRAKKIFAPVVCSRSAKRKDSTIDNIVCVFIVNDVFSVRSSNSWNETNSNCLIVSKNQEFRILFTTCKFVSNASSRNWSCVQSASNRWINTPINQSVNWVRADIDSTRTALNSGWLRNLVVRSAVKNMKSPVNRVTSFDRTSLKSKDSIRIVFRKQTSSSEQQTRVNSHCWSVNACQSIHRTFVRRQTFFFCFIRLSVELARFFFRIRISTLPRDLSICKIYFYFCWKFSLW